PSTYRINIGIKAGASDTLTKNNYAIFPTFTLKNIRCENSRENTFYGAATDLRANLGIDEISTLSLDVPAAALTELSFTLNAIERNFLGDWYSPPTSGSYADLHVFAPLVFLIDKGIQVFQAVAVTQHENIVSKVVAIDPNDRSEHHLVGAHGAEFTISAAPLQRANLAGTDLARLETELSYRLESYKSKLRGKYGGYKGPPGVYGSSKADFELYKRMQNDVLNFAGLAAAKGDRAKADSAINSLCLSGVKR
ncbi:MAG TPA: hypothetical protein VFV50_02465, partial [Bdellovibrionales bacterium]|nr:hypothetical protein [Bdellovibrionales bacterium]